MGSCRDVIHNTGHRYVSHPPQRHDTFSVLRRFLGIGRIELSARAGNATEILFDVTLCPRVIEAARDVEKCIVRLINSRRP